jgi:adhesin/invasin
VRRAVRSIAALIGAVGVTMCVDTTAPREGQPIRASFALAPEFSPAAHGATRALAAAGLPLDRVRILLVRGTETLKDTTITAHSGDSLTVELTVGAVVGEKLGADMQFKSGETVLFEGTATVTAVPTGATGGAAASTPIQVTYVGPGATAASVSVAPSDGDYVASGTISFSASALDDKQAAIANTPFVWTIDDATLGTIDANTGDFTPSGKRGTLTVTAATLSGIKGTAVARLFPVPSGISIISGDNQTAPAGTTLSQPLVVAVTGSDNGPVIGQTVTFTAPDGGSVNPASAVTGSDGRAQTTVTLGSSVKSYTFTATSGTFAVGATETATLGAAAKMTVVGATSFTATSGVKAATVPTVQITDAAGNPVPNVATQLSLASQTVSVDGDTTLVSDASGLVAVPDLYPLEAEAGVYTLTMTVPGLAGSPATFTITIVPGAAARLAFTTFASPSTVNGKPLPQQPVLQVTDINDNPVAQAGVTITATEMTINASVSGGTVTTDANGVATFTTLTLTGVAGPRALQFASAGLISANAPVEITPGVPANMFASATPSGIGFIGQATPVIPAVKVVDKSGNGVAGVHVMFAVRAGAGFVTNPDIVTNVQGIAKPDAWNLALVPIDNLLEARAYDPSGGAIGFNGSTSGTLTIERIANNPVVFKVTGITPTALNMNAMSTTTQTGTAGQSVAALPAVLITDSNGKPVPNINVMFTVTAGIGSTVVASTPVVTGIDGIARVGDWILGTAAGTYTVTAVAGQNSDVGIGFSGSTSTGSLTPGQIANNPIRFTATVPPV